MRFLRRLVTLILLVVLGLWGFIIWLESPGGTKTASRWITAQMQRNFPETQVLLEQLKFHLPLRFEVGRATWRSRDVRSILTVNDLDVTLCSWHTGLRHWTARGEVARLDLGALDYTLAKGEWKAGGLMTGTARVEGKGLAAESVVLNLSSLKPGGDLNSEVLGRLAGMMPAGDARAMLLKALSAKATFHFNVGHLSMSTEGEDYLLSLLLDGDHLLDLKIRIPRGSLDLLKTLSQS